jgi:hypothetical protein
MKALKTALLLPVIAAYTACTPDDLLLYEEPADVYFTTLATQSRANDSAFVRFTYTTLLIGEEHLLHIPINTTGRLSNQDREVRVVANFLESTALPNIHYIAPLSATIRAGRATDTLTIRMIRHASLSQNEEELVLVLELQENDYFGVRFNSMLDINTQRSRSLIQYKVYISDIIVQPFRWLDIYFGTFSAKKLLLISRLSGLSLPYMDGQPDENGETVKPWELQSAAVITKAYLDYEAAQGRTVYENYLGPDGQPVRMTMGNSI